MSDQPQTTLRKVGQIAIVALGIAWATATQNDTRWCFPDMHNVLCWGADPTGVRDSTPAINAAIEFAGVERIIVPSGHYLVSQPIPVEAFIRAP